MGWGECGIEYSERARVGRQKLKRRAEIERLVREANETFPRPCTLRFGRAGPGAEMEASLVNWKSYKSVRGVFSRRSRARKGKII